MAHTIQFNYRVFLAIAILVTGISVSVYWNLRHTVIEIKPGFLSRQYQQFTGSASWLHENAFSTSKSSAASDDYSNIWRSDDVYPGDKGSSISESSDYSSSEISSEVSSSYLSFLTSDWGGKLLGKGTQSKTDLKPAKENDVLMRTSLVQSNLQAALMTPKNKSNSTARNSLCDDECKWLKEQKSRRQTVHDACAKYGDNQSLTQDILPQVLVSDKYKTLYCYVPKVACSTWKRLILLMNGINATVVHHTEIPNLSQFSAKEVQRRIQNYKKFIIVRNPHERLLSAYQEKFAHVSKFNEHILKHFGQRIRIQNIEKLVKIYYPNDSKVSNAFRKWRKKIKNQSRVFVTFQEFVKYVGDITNHLDEPTEKHWREIYRLCNPCAINFDFIGKLETAADDSKFILHQIGADHLISETLSKPHATNSSSENKVSLKYKRLTKETIVKFERRFERDFKMFGYERPAAIVEMKSKKDDDRDSMNLLETLFQRNANK